MVILSCLDCPLLTKIPNIEGLIFLNCSGCPVTEIPVINGLKELRCSYCPLLTEIPNICYNSPLITEIPNITELEYLDCSDCPIKKINIRRIKTLICINCRLLTKVSSDRLVCQYCPWLSQNYKNKISQGIKLQRWIKSNFRYFVFKNWISSPEGREWIYNPDNVGGRIEKSKIRNTFKSLNFHI